MEQINNAPEKVKLIDIVSSISLRITKLNINKISTEELEALKNKIEIEIENRSNQMSIDPVQLFNNKV